MKSNDKLLRDLNDLEPWSYNQWRFMLNGRFSIGQAIACLGFAGPLHGATCKALEREATKLAKKYPSTWNTFLEKAADSDYLDQELGCLLEKCGPGIWGRQADRSRLLTPATSKLYSKDLSYEEHEHREM